MAPKNSIPTKKPYRKGWAAFIRRIYQPERAFYQICIIYGIAVSLLSLAVPIAVQMVINTVANTAQELSLFVVCTLTVLMLTAAALLYALQIYGMELFCRRFFARNVSEMVIGLTDACAAGWKRPDAFEQIKRYYEIIAVQKSIPGLVITGISMLFQMVVGLLLVAMYHPFLLAFNVIFVALCFVIAYLWHAAARETARELSVAKYEMAGWLGEFSANAEYMDAEQTAEALKRTNTLTHEYIDARRAFFHASFSQTVGYLLLYILSSAGLLGLGGWLVIGQQLTLGQLAAAEIILSSVFYSLMRLGYYLRVYYEACVSAEKIDELYGDPAATLGMTKDIQ